MKELLQDGTVNRVLGWKKGDLPYNPEPAFFKSAEELDEFIYDGFCGANLSKYMIKGSNLEGKTLIIADPMLATGASMVAVYKELIARCGKPAHTHIASVIGCPEGVKMIEQNIDLENEATLWIATVDEYLNENKYIVPGLGDAGDLCFGAKL